MLNKLRKIVIVGVALMGAVVAHGATTRYVELRSTLQPNTTGLNAIFVSSGSIKNFSASTATVTGPLTVTGLSTLASVSLTTISGTINDVSTTTHSGGQTFSTMTVTDARFLAMTVSGAIKDRTLSTGTTWDYMLGGSSSTWSHAGLIIQRQQFTTTTSSATTSSTFIPTNVFVTITPKFASSVIRLGFSGTLQDSNPTGDSCFMTLERNASNLAGSTNDFVRMTQTTATSVNIPASFGPYYDSPNSTSAITYQVYFRTSAGGSTCTVNAASFGVLLAEEIGQ